MKITVHAFGKEYTADLSRPIDISLPVTANGHNPIAWYLGQPVIEPVKMGDWTGKVSEGASTNFNNIYFNPHGHGTHTECLGHITREFYSINKALTKFFFVAEVISVTPETIDGDSIITRQQLESALTHREADALVIRTLPNKADKKHANYSHTNPPYLAEEGALYIRERGVKHLLIDLPSVDREEDGGRLVSHKVFWNVKDVNDLNADARHDATITEMIFVPDEVGDGRYLLNLQIASFENDASPSKPVLYQLEAL